MATNNAVNNTMQSITFTTTSGIIGTTTNNNAAAGSVGEDVQSRIALGSAVALTNNTVANVTSISLTAGDWDVWGNVVFDSGGGTTMTWARGAINTVSATLPSSELYTSIAPVASVIGTGIDISAPIPPFRFSLSTTTTIYLMAQANFAVNTLGAYGYIEARRRR